jgi:hypothetical protein
MPFHQVRTLYLRLDAFGDDLQAEAEAHRDHRVDDRRRLGLRHDGANEREIDLERVDGEPLQTAEHRVPRAEVIDCDAHSKVADVLQQAERLAMLAERRRSR